MCFGRVVDEKTRIESFGFGGFDGRVRAVRLRLLESIRGSSRRREAGLWVLRSSSCPVWWM